MHLHGNHQGFDLPAGLYSKTTFEVIIPVKQPADRILFLVEMAERKVSGKERLRLLLLNISGSLDPFHHILNFRIRVIIPQILFNGV